MHAVAVVITRFVDEHQPGFVECTLVDAHGVTHVFVEKVPIVTSKDLRSDSPYPQEGSIACTVLRRFVGSKNEALVEVDTELPWHVESTNGQTVFVVVEHQVVTIA
jgi:hypothetical protein